jgi:hypothetical protein
MTGLTCDRALFRMPCPAVLSRVRLSVFANGQFDNVSTHIDDLVLDRFRRGVVPFRSSTSLLC